MGRLINKKSTKSSQIKLTKKSNLHYDTISIGAHQSLNSSITSTSAETSNNMKFFVIVSFALIYATSANATDTAAASASYASASASSDDTSFAIAYASSATNNNKSSTLTCLEMCVDDAVQSGKKKYSVNNKNKINKSASKCAEDCTTKRSVSKCADPCFKRLSRDVQKVVDSEVRKCERKCNNDDPDYQKCKNKCSSSKSVSKKTFKKIERNASDKSYRCLNSCVYSDEGTQTYLRSQI